MPNISASLMIYAVCWACDKLSSRKHRSTTHMSPFFIIVCRSFGISTNISFLSEHFNNIFGCRANGLHNGTFNTIIITNYVTIKIMGAWIIFITSQNGEIYCFTCNGCRPLRVGRKRRLSKRKPNTSMIFIFS